MAFPKVNGIDKASAQGQATIKTAETTLIAVVMSVLIQYIPDSAAIIKTANVKYLATVSERWLNRSFVSFS